MPHTLSKIWKWLPVIFLIPLLYLFGWLLVQPLRLLGFIVDQNILSILGTFISFTLFLCILPSWLKVRWLENRCWEDIGLLGFPISYTLRIFCRGFIWALFLILTLIFLVNLIYPIQFEFVIDLDIILNAIFLGFVVGFAEEIIFRSWLWGELNRLIGSRKSLYYQAIIFSFLHLKFELDFISLAGLLFGLFLLGLILSLRRKIDGGSIWGCVGMHGGLVGIWFLLSNGIVRFSPNTPNWLIGPGGFSPNPIGGVIGIVLLILILCSYRDNLMATGA